MSAAVAAAGYLFRQRLIPLPHYTDVGGKIENHRFGASPVNGREIPAEYLKPQAVPALTAAGAG